MSRVGLKQLIGRSPEARALIDATLLELAGSTDAE